ncbi:chemotaxis-specific protein-glutamate methyltransferase CheB [Curvibacter sp. RS43]|jgi:two-component system chemotaxis response regulator CheB|uniref:chemotaxis-specific protein-glutamate methyltransferase CheB n=1 Tax=Curvibacter microcysteis TaxID=3026419 RepID=UPI0023609E70|nr:chemotaxis-specific protein-glutamate methyltransferase CheB [Curvibacter sp. RS43]MDD0812514.1 chemotaxis-specific protein-glutamate methyltransferase CheB [Curvibacter sp. RS43]
MIKLLIVDDSALMRRQLAQLFQAAGGFDIRQARNGVEAVTENRDFQPDVVTLDINMPEMDGITALSLIMAERPVPVIMVSSLTEKGALATFEALNLGAVDYVAKPGGTISLSLEVVKADLLAKVRAAAKSRPAKFRSMGLATARPARTSPDLLAPKSTAVRSGPASDGVLLIGVSTGGPRALEQVLPLLPADFPWPVLVAQHMPASFTAPFAARLNTSCELEVVEAASPMPVQAGRVYIGKGGADMVLTRRANVLTVLPKPEDSSQLWHPSVELLGRSALQHCNPRHLVGVMLTGMGYDGADAFADIKRQGGKTIAEAESTAVVFGMPAELIERGGASLVLPLDKIAAQVKAWAQR